MTFEEAFHDARGFHARGDLAKAIEGYHRALEQDPGHPEAWHLKGVAEHQSGLLDEALESARRAIAAGGERAPFLLFEGDVLHDRGVLSMSSDGYREYRVGPAGKAMFEAIVAFLTTDMGATRSAEDLAAYGYQAHVNGQIVHVIDSDHDHHIGIYMDRVGDTKLVVTIAERFDAALATGKYDALFVK